MGNNIVKNAHNESEEIISVSPCVKFVRVHLEQNLSQIKNFLWLPFFSGVRLIKITSYHCNYVLNRCLFQKRDGLTKIKQNRDALRNENQELSRKCGLLGNETLLRDYEEKYAESTELKTRLAQLKTRHTELSMKCTGYKKKIEEARSGIMIT